MITISRELSEAILSNRKVTEEPHCFYNYPARFSAEFARSAIEAFSRPGDVVLDPFCGGGTTLIEAVRLGRRAIGFDVNELATFITKAKLTFLSKKDVTTLHQWVGSITPVPDSVSINSWENYDRNYYERNLPLEPLRFFRSVVAHIESLTKPNQRQFARLVLLSVGQWAVDCKKQIPDFDALSKQFKARCIDFSSKQHKYLTEAAVANDIYRCHLNRHRRIINRASEYCGIDGRIPQNWKPVDLVLTSPPYPGVHVLYHRWQVHGSRETPAPYMLANCRDGDGESFYCLGSRRDPNCSTYFKRIHEIFTSLRSILSCRGLVVQLVSFSNPDIHLPKYLLALEQAGFESVHIGRDECGFDGYIRRSVPNRKFYNAAKKDRGAGTEFFLIHRPVRAPLSLDFRGH